MAAASRTEWVQRAFGVCAFLAVVGCRPVAPPALAPAPPRPTTVPTTVPTPSPPPAPPATATLQPRHVIRVLLATAGDITLPEPGRRYRLDAVGSSTVVRGPIVARLVRRSAAVQLGAFEDQRNAAALLDRLRAAGFGCELEPKGGGRVAVVATSRPSETESELASRLLAAGFREQVPLPLRGEAEVSGEEGPCGRGKELLLRPLDDRPVDTGTITVRGDFVVRVENGSVLLINVLDLEDYLRGVVPAEMGPRAFPALEALKAQAVAARTYAVAHLGDHEDQGYDICGTTACQVYGGTRVEHPLSDQAVHETEGLLVTYAGRPIDAMYHSTCGGQTEDAAVLLPERAAPYLLGVPCRGEGWISAGEAEGDWFGPLDRLVLVGQRLAAQRDVAPRARELAAKLGGRPAREGLNGLAEALGVQDTKRLLHAPGQDADSHVDELLQVFKLPLPPRGPSQERSRWELAAVVRLAQLGGVVDELPGRVLLRNGRLLFVGDGPSPEERELSGDELTLERRGETWRLARVRALPGSPATLWCAGGTSLLLEVSPLVEADARSQWNWWVREFTAEDAGRRLGIAGLRDLSVARRGSSGRAVAVTLTGDAGRSEVGGFACRMALGLPDTLFVVVRRDTPAGNSFRFLGRGWGHGIGLCQNGAYGMALAGAAFDEILKTYYTGVEVEPWQGGMR